MLSCDWFNSVVVLVALDLLDLLVVIACMFWLPVLVLVWVIYDCF